MMYTYNSTENNMYEDSEKPSPIQIFIMYMVTAGAMLTNLTVFYTVPKLHGKINSSTRLAMLNLAITDTLLGTALFISRTVYVTSRPVYFKHWCNVDGGLSLIAACMSIYSVTFLNLNKFLTLKFPLRYRSWMTCKKTVAFLVGTWLFVIAYYMRLFYLNTTGAYIPTNTFVCFDFDYDLGSYNYILYIMDTTFFLALPFCISLIALIGIGCILKRNKTRVSQLQEGQPGLLKNDRAVVYAILFINLAFVTMIAPHFIVFNIFPIITDEPTGPIPNFVATWVGAANSAINPLIYIPTMRSYRQELKKGLQRLFNRMRCNWKGHRIQNTNNAAQSNATTSSSTI